MESRKDLYDKNAGEKGVDMVSLDRDTMIRISKNPGWYQALYKSYDCAPNARELYDIAHKKMKTKSTTTWTRTTPKAWPRKKPWKPPRKESNPLNG